MPSKHICDVHMMKCVLLTTLLTEFPKAKSIFIIEDIHIKYWIKSSVS